MHRAYDPDGFIYDALLFYYFHKDLYSGDDIPFGVKDDPAKNSGYQTEFTGTYPISSVQLSGVTNDDVILAAKDDSIYSKYLFKPYDVNIVLTKSIDLSQWSQGAMSGPTGSLFEIKTFPVPAGVVRIHDSLRTRMQLIGDEISVIDQYEKNGVDAKDKLINFGDKDVPFGPSMLSYYLNNKYYVFNKLIWKWFGAVLDLKTLLVNKAQVNALDNSSFGELKDVLGNLYCSYKVLYHPNMTYALDKVNSVFYNLMDDFESESVPLYKYSGGYITSKVDWKMFAEYDLSKIWNASPFVGTLSGMKCKLSTNDANKFLSELNAIDERLCRKFSADPKFRKLKDRVMKVNGFTESFILNCCKILFCFGMNSCYEISQSIQTGFREHDYLTTHQIDILGYGNLQFKSIDTQALFAATELLYYISNA